MLLLIIVVYSYIYSLEEATFLEVIYLNKCLEMYQFRVCWLKNIAGILG